jgi:MFS family permease
LCALSPNLISLISARVLQGFGGALMIPVGRLIILRNFAKGEFAKAMSLVVVPGLLGPALGPTIGGLILHVASWHWIFLVNIPLGLIGMVIAYHFIPKNQPHNTPPFNWLGFLFFSVGLMAITSSMALLGDNFDLLNISLLLAGLAIFSFVIYLKISKPQPHPLINLKLFHQKTFRIAIITSLIVRPSIGAMPFLIPLLLQMVWGQTALYSGLAYMFLALGMLISRFLLADKLLKRFNYRMLMTTNVLSTTFISANLVWFTSPQPFYLLAILLFCQGVLTSQFYTSLGMLTVLEVEPENYSQSTSISSVTQQFSAGIGIALTAILLHLMNNLLQEPLFSSRVFFWTILILNALNLISLRFIKQLDPKLNLATSLQSVH